MKFAFKTLAITGLLAAVGFAAFAQSPGMGMADRDSGGRMGHMGQMGRMDPAKMDQMMAKRSADLKAKLKITPAQEGAWTAFIAAMKPDTSQMAKHQAERAGMEKLSTPERIDKMHALRAQRMADMSATLDKRDNAVKTFYATLAADQKNVFDTEHRRMGGRHGSDHGAHKRSASAAPKQ